MKNLVGITLSFILTLAALNSYSSDHSILEFGAKGDGVTMNTKAIQSCIDKVHSEGGGKVIIPSGTFLTGSIVLKSKVELHLTKKATLLGSNNVADYKRLHRWMAIVLADSANNIAITGKGTIDGQGCALALHIDSLYYAGKLPERKYDKPEKRPKPDARPQLVEFTWCKNVRIEGITMKNASSWVQTYDACENLIIDKIRVESDAYWNNDGIDIIDSKNVKISNCFVNASDDGICIKSFRHGPYIIQCENIHISNCKVRSSASAIKLGTSSYGGFKNVVIEDIRVFDTYRSAIALETYETGVLENILVQNIKATNTGNAIFIRLGHRTKYYFERTSTAVLKNVTIRNMKVKVPAKRPDAKYKMQGPALPFFHNTFPSSIVGIPEQSIENVTLENISIIYPGGGDPCYANLPLNRLDSVPENREMYPEFSMFGELPAWGFYVRHVDGLKMKNVQVKIRKADYRPAFVLDDAKNVQFTNVQVKGDNKAKNVKAHKSSNLQLGGQ